MCLASTYVRWPGRDTRRRPEIAERRSSVYFRRIWISCPARAVGRGHDRPRFDVALLVEDPRELALELGRGHVDRLVRGVDRVAHAREEVGYGIGHRHVFGGLIVSSEEDPYQEDFVIPGIWPLWARSRRQMRHTPNFRYTARGRPQRVQRV